MLSSSEFIHVYTTTDYPFIFVKYWFTSREDMMSFDNDILYIKRLANSSTMFFKITKYSFFSALEFHFWIHDCSSKIRLVHHRQQPISIIFCSAPDPQAIVANVSELYATTTFSQQQRQTLPHTLVHCNATRPFQAMLVDMQNTTDSPHV